MPLRRTKKIFPMVITGFIVATTGLIVTPVAVVHLAAVVVGWTAQRNKRAIDVKRWKADPVT